MKMVSRLLHKFDAPAPQRPVWQRILLPLVGIVAVVVGIIGWLMPIIPGAPLAIVGLPWLFCVNRRSEEWMRRQLRTFGAWLRARRERREQREQR